MKKQDSLSGVYWYRHMCECSDSKPWIVVGHVKSSTKKLNDNSFGQTSSFVQKLSAFAASLTGAEVELAA